MWPLAHLGIGSAMGRVGSPKLPFHWLLLGTLLPDLIDKPFYFGLGVYEHFSNGGWVPGKRGFAHTVFFLLLLTGIAVVRRSAPLIAVSVGTATHLVLDLVSKLFGPHHLASDSLAVLFWPLMGWGFPTLSNGLHGLWAVVLELIGLALLLVQMTVIRFRPE
jgi:hypothetical protein